MIYIFCALYPEAESVIRTLHLKRQQESLSFEVFANDTIRLILMGSGSWSAAVAVGSSLAYFHAGTQDVCINWGSCASHTAEVGTLFLCHQLIDRVSGHTFYPDMVFASPLPEASVITEPHFWKFSEMPWKQETMAEQSREVLHDMEAAAVYFAASYTFSPHQMHFLKVVSDQGMGNISAETLSQVMEQNLGAFESYLQMLFAYIGEGQQRHRKMQKEQEILKQLCEEFHCSQTMEHSLWQSMRYWTLTGVDYQAALQRMRKEGLLPCKDRREGKKRLEQLQNGRIENEDTIWKTVD